MRILIDVKTKRNVRISGVELCGIASKIPDFASKTSDFASKISEFASKIADFASNILDFRLLNFHIFLNFWPHHIF